MIPKVVSHYRLLNHLGEGGMGVVYRAEDLRLGREVAIKLLRTEAVASSEWLARFEREARLASSLQHPHICTIHELGEHEGQPFIAMELLEGRTIRQIAESGPLPAGRILDFACQIASALDAAHRRGIVHRDIKPANLFVTHGERLKVLDFGLAKMAGDEPVGGHTASSPTLPSVMASDLTRTGSTVGTASYMAPEQAQGEPVDARTDLFSLGSVLYEMATGRRAFGGDDIPLIVMKIINGIVVPPRSVNAEVPEDLERIIQRLMAVNPADRFQTAGELLAGLQRVIHGREHGAGESPGSGPQTIAAAPARTRRRWAAAAAIGFVILAAGAGAAWRARRPPALTDRDSILIAGFENTTANTMFDATLLTALKAHLGQSPFLDIIADQRIRETLESMSRSADEALTHETAREVCQRMSVKAMLEGAVAPLGTHFVVTLNATDCQTGSSLARLQAEASSPERVLTELGTLSSSMRTALGESLPSVQRFGVPIEQATTPSLAALKAYTLGLEERRRGRELESVAFFNQAIEIDPEFVAAYTTLSTVYGSVGEWRRSEDYARLANNVTRRMSERERLFVTYQFHDRVSGNQQRAAETLEIWKASYPRDFRPVNALALIHNRAGQYEKAEAEAKEALRRSPGHPFPLSNLAFAYRAMGRYDEARRTAEEAVSLRVETTPTRRLLYQVGLVMGDGSAFQHLTWARGKPREFDLISAQAQAAAYHGRLREARELYQRASYMARARDLQGAAAGYDAHLAFTDALLRPRQEAIVEVKRLLRAVNAEEDLGGTVPRFRIAVALGLLGQTAEAQTLMGQAQQRYPDSTFVRTVVTPSARAAIAIASGRPDTALAALEAAVPTQAGTVAGLVPFYLRAEALMLKGTIPDAVAEYENILKHRGVDPFAPVVPLAHLGIARARAAIGDVEGSRRAYEDLFTAWKGADEDLPLLAAARTEYGRVTTRPATMASTAR